jgi:5-methylcytosine-specific restriction endonuclease McrA
VSSAEWRRAYNKVWYATHKEHAAAYAKDYREKNLDACIERCRNYKDTHREELSKHDKEYAATHVEQVREKRRKYHAKNRGKLNKGCRDWYEFNKDYCRKYAVTRGWFTRAIKNNSPGAHYTTAEMIEARCELWGNRCWMCGGPMQGIDHVKPLSKKGAHLPCNIRPICRSCNSRKSNKWPIETAKIKNGGTSTCQLHYLIAT